MIAANGAFNTWKSENFLTLPFNNLDRVEFVINLMRYYQATNDIDLDKAFNKMMELLPSKVEREAHLKEPLSEAEKNHQKLSSTIKIKKEFRNNK